MAEAAVVESVLSETDSPLVSVSFQRNEQRKLKFLEGEPKALGITQICLIVFHMSCVAAFHGSSSNYMNNIWIGFFISSVFVFIAGSVAIAAKNLHLPTLKACLGMEVVAIVASIYSLNLTIVQMVIRFSCYRFDPADEEKRHCLNIEAAHMHLYTAVVVIHVALFAISVTLVVYACKVVNCCSPAPKVPVISVQALPAPL